MEINGVKYISELLFQHDCVIIPGFGGFIGNYSPAAVNPVHHTFYPPYKSLLFNIHLKQNDGLLAARISLGERISYEEALDNIAMMVKSWNRVLETEQELVIDKVGKITRETEDILQFEQDLSVNYLPDAFGLPSLVSPAIRRPGFQDKLEKQITRYIVPPGRHRMMRKTMKWAAILVFPIGMAVYFSLANIDRIQDFRDNYAWILFTNSSTIQKKVAEDKGSTLAAGQKTIIPEGFQKKEQKQKIEESISLAISSPSPRNFSQTPAGNQAYAIIVGAFRFRENADNLVSKLKEGGYEASLYDVTSMGLFRVSVGSYDNKEEAVKMLALVRTKDYSTAWLLQK
jgi:cell division septation protein DedD